MAIISRLAVLLGLDAGEFNANLGKAKDKLSGFASEAKVGLAGVGAVFLGATKAAADYADKINDVAKANDMSVQSVLRMSQALAINGGNTEDASKLMSAFSNKVDEAAQGSSKAQKAFTSIGVSLKDLRTLNPQELFEKTVKSLAAIEDTTHRNALAMDMFGRAIKGVDIKGLAESLDQNKQSFEDAEVAFKKIGLAFDKIDVAMQSLKVNTAKNTSDIITYLGDWAEAHITNGDKIKARNDELIKQYGYIKTLMEMIGLIKLEPVVGEIGSVQGAKAPSILTGIGGTAAPKKNIRDVKDDEILKKQHEYYQKELLITQAKMGRMKLENDLAFASENERKIALEYYDLQQKILALRNEKKMTEADIAKYAEAEKIRIQEEEKILENQKTFSYGWKKAFEQYYQDANDASKNAERLFVHMASAMEDAIAKFIRTGKLDFKGFANAVLDEIARMEARLIASKIFKFLKMDEWFGGKSAGGWDEKSSGSGGGVLGSIFGSIGSIFGFADGGNPPVGVPSLVGERGPELFIPNQSGTIIPNNQLGSVMGNQPQVVYNGTVIQNMSAIDTQSATQFLAKNKQAVWSANQSAQRSLPQSR